MKLARFAFLFLIATAFTFPAKDVKLEYSFKVGDQYTWTQSSHQTIKQSIPGMGDISVVVDIGGVMNLKITEVTATEAKIEIQYESMKMTTKSSMGMGDTSMDSEGPMDNPQNKTVKALMGKPFFFTLTKQGIVQSVENTDNLYSGFESLGLDEATLKATKQQFQQTLGEKSLKSSLEMALITYPDKKVKAAESWKSSGTLAMNFPVKIDNTWTLKSVDASNAVVNGAGILTTTDKDQVVDLPNGMKSKFNLNGQQTMSGSAGVKTGWPSTLKINSELKGTMTLLAGGMIPTDMDVPMEIVTQSDYTLVKK